MAEHSVHDDPFTLKWQIRCRNAANRTISISPIKTFSGPTTGWIRAAATVTPPAGTNNARLELAATSLNATAYVDDVSYRATR